jgi:hypothetical protein
MGGGPSAAQTNAANAQTDLTKELTNVFGKQQAFQQAQQEKANPFYSSLMQNGLPYIFALQDAQSGTNAQAFAPARAQLEQQLGQSGNAMPSGFATSARMNLADQQAKSYDQTMMQNQGANLQAKMQGASGLLGQAQIANPTAYSGQAIQGNQSIMGAPLASPGLGGLLGGFGGGLLSSIPF